ncbi:hypothetical protein EJ08DRAFT_652063 [Tothia fuscella]|uniref:Pre-mRNA polyadenylation factor Fip1 domain-containing protein n=1 Tax=Tothia fuscella TaxID=1048955 RepID=A0A9P4NKQ3_9PEZI|nr:hypothetical protein EJ08DRAFT_652063 [Tothia fuscella]
MGSSRESSLGSDAMEEEDDDLYGTGPVNNGAGDAPNGKVDDGDKMEEELEDGEEEDEEEEEDSESDIEIVTEKQDGPESSIPTRFTKSEPTQDGATTTTTNTTTTATTSKPHTKPSSAIKIVDPTTLALTRTPNPNQPLLLPGDKYPALRTSTISLDTIPLWNGKPITDLDIDADLAEQAKPWRRPGADQSEYFNYGFDEFTWSTYVMKQQTMKKALQEQKEETRMFESSLAGMGMPLPPGMPPMGGGGTAPSAPPAGPAGMGGMPTMPGMPSMDDMQAMFMQAVASGQDPSQMDFGSFMQGMGGAGGGGVGQGGGMGVPTGPSGGQQQQQQQWGQQQGYQQQGQGHGGHGQQQGGGRRGRGRGWQ